MRAIRFQLVARINDPDLLEKSVHELGTVFYQEDQQGNITRVVYFSTSRIVEYTGKVDGKLAKRIRIEGHQAQNIHINELHDSIEILQNKTG